MKSKLVSNHEHGDGPLRLSFNDTLFILVGIRVEPLSRVQPTDSSTFYWGNLSAATKAFAAHFLLFARKVFYGNFINF
jgi:hypothetical protein